MRWFKHYSDNYRGRSIDHLFEHFGHCGISSYFLLTELCVEKIEKIKERDLEISDMNFGFSERFVRKNLRVSSAKLQQILNICQGFGLFSFELSEKELKIYYPILLDLLDSDQKKTRSRREQDATQTRLDKDKDKDRDKDKENKKKKTIVAEAPVFDFDFIYSQFPRKEGKSSGIAKLSKTIKTQTDYDLLLQATRNYANLTKFDDVKFIKHFSTFVGSWRDYISPEKPKTYEERMLGENPFRGEL